MDEATARAAIVAEARSWLGTPYQHEGDVKGIGTDCGMILVRIYVDLGLIPPFDPRPYNRDHMQHSTEEKYVSLVRRCGGIEFPGPPKSGDVAIWKFGLVYSHGALVVDWPKVVIHAHARHGRVMIEDAGTNATMLAKKHGPIRFFSLWPTP